MLVTVEDGRAVGVAGDPAHPVTAGFLCGKVSNYLERVYAADRILHPLVRDGPKGEARFRRASWDEALDMVAGRLRETIDRFGGEAVLPYSYYGAQGVAPVRLDERALHARDRRDAARADDLRQRGNRGDGRHARPVARGRPGGVAATRATSSSGAGTRCRRLPTSGDSSSRRAGTARVWSWSTRTGAAPPGSPTSTSGRDPGTDGALALGMMRAMVDAGLADDAWCREHAVGYDELLERLGEYTVERCAGICDVPPETIERLGRDFATEQPSLLRLGVGAQRHAGAPIAYRTIACVPALAGSWRHRGGGFSYIPTATAGALDSSVLRRADLSPGPVRTINMARLGTALNDGALEPPVAALVVWCSNPAAIAPDQASVLAGLRREDLFTVVLEQFVTDTAAYADVVLPATTQLEHLDLLVVVGPPLPHVQRSRDRAARRGPAEHGDLPAPGRPPGLRRPVLLGDGRGDALVALRRRRAGGITLGELRLQGWAKVDLGQGAEPHAARRIPDGEREARAPLGVARGARLRRASVLRPAGRDRGRRPRDRFPLCLLTPKTHLFLNSTFPEPGGVRPAPSPDRSSPSTPTTRASAGSPTATASGSSTTAAPSSPRPPSPRTPGRACAVSPMGWWNRSWPSGTSCQATTSQRLTRLRAAPTFNDNRVEIARLEDPGRSA